MIEFQINDKVVVHHKGFMWGGCIISVQPHDNGNNYYVESTVNHYKGWYSANYLKAMLDPNNLMKEIL